MKTIIIVGGGPAGMMAAVSATGKKNNVLILEKMECMGKKLSITGKGRCNLTNKVENHKELIDSYPGGGNFLHSTFNRFSPRDLINFFESKGVVCKVERGKRVFPQSDRAEDVTGTLFGELKKLRIDVHLETPVTEIITASGKISGVKTVRGDFIKADKVILSTGGMTYPWTGSTGDGYHIAKKLGHQVTTPRPSLVPLEVEEKALASALEGLSLRNVRAVLRCGNRIVEEKFGEMVFTSYGLSGPIILHMSRNAVLLLAEKKGDISVSLDLKPALSKDKLKYRLEKDLEKYRKKQFKNSLDELLPQKLIPVFAEATGISATKQCAHVNAREKERIIDSLKCFTFKIHKARGISEAEVTQGGVMLKEVDPKTMESRINQGLYFAGEVLDIDGFIGGYNLQAAFSTGFVAGSSAAQY